MLLTIVVPGVAMADAKQEIRASYDKMAAAAHAHDVPGAAKFYATDFTTNVGGRIVRRPEFVAMQRKVVSMSKSILVTHHITSIAVNGAEATAMCTVQNLVQVKGSDGRLHDLVIDETRQDIWADRGGKWLLRHMQVLKEQVTLDHKHIPVPESN